MSLIRTVKSAAVMVVVMACVPVWGEPPVGDKKAASGVAAYVDGKPITMDEVDAIAVGQNMKLAQSLYDARRSALEELLLKRALGPEASEKGITVDELIRQRVQQKTDPVSDADIAEFYEQNKNRMRGRSLEQMSGQIRNHLAGKAEADGRNALIAEITGKQDIKIILDPPRVDISVSADEPSKGPATAKVTIVEYSEFQ